MRKLAVLAFVTLDGVMQSPGAPDEDTSGGFTHGGWAAPFWDSVMPNVECSAMSTPYDLLLGRKTYDIFAAHWPKAPKSDIAGTLNAARKYVMTSSTDTLKWKNSCAITGDAAQKIRELKAQEGPLLQVHGSAELIQMLHANDLIDELRIWTFPVSVGSGKRLFDANCRPTAYALLESEALDNGVTKQIFRPIRSGEADIG